MSKPTFVNFGSEYPRPRFVKNEWLVPYAVTPSTDDDDNDVSNSIYNGTTEDLLSIIKDLRARVTALENA